MNISMTNFSVFSQRMGRASKSAQQKLERQQKMQSQVDFFEEKKAGLKDMKCETLDEIAQKLELFNNYDAQILAAKQQYNQEQMMHTLDEAQERGEEIAKAAEKQKPKTPEERKREQIEEALGTEDEGGMLTEMLEEELLEASELQEQMVEEQLEQEELLEEQLSKELSEELLAKEELSEEAAMSAENVVVVSEGISNKSHTQFDMRA